MQSRAYLGLGFMLALGIVVVGLVSGGSTLAQTIPRGACLVSVPASGGTTTCFGFTFTLPPGAVPAGSTLAVSQLAAPPAGTTLPGVGTILHGTVMAPTGQASSGFAAPETVTGPGNACFLLDEGARQFVPVPSTPGAGGQVTCSFPRPGIKAVVTVSATPTPGGAAPGVTPTSRPAVQAFRQAPDQAPDTTTAPAQAPADLPRTGGASFPVGVLALAGVTLAGLGLATRRSGRA